MSLSKEKYAIRTALLRQRAKLPQARQQQLGGEAQARLLELDAFRSAEVVALYSPIRNEVPTALLLHQALALGKTVCYPCVAGSDLHFFQVESEAEMQVGCFGICEPDRNGREIGPERIGLMLIPGVAFDRRGHRLGYGRGYFDRLLEGGRFGGLRIGFGYDFQLVERLPVEPHDQILDLLVTEKQVLTPSEQCC